MRTRKLRIWTLFTQWCTVQRRIQNPNASSQMFDRVPEHASAVKTWNKICIIFRLLRLVRKMKWEKSFRKCKSMFKYNNKNTELLCWIYSKLIIKTPLVSLLSALIDFMPLVFFYISWKVFFSGYRKRTVAWNQLLKCYKETSAIQRVEVIDLMFLLITRNVYATAGWLFYFFTSMILIRASAASNDFMKKLPGNI